MGKDFWESITEWVHERVSSPILSTFTFMWIITNYKVVIVLISENSYLDRFKYLDSYKELDKYFIYRIIFPAILTAIYLRFYPILRNGVYDYWSALQAEMDGIKVKNFKLKTLSEEEKLALIEANVESKRKYDTDINERDDLIKLLNSQIASLKSESSDKSNPSSKSDDVHTNMKILLNRLNDNGTIQSRMLLDFLRQLYGISSQSYGNALAKASAANFISIQGSNETAQVSITDAGKKYITR